MHLSTKEERDFLKVAKTAEVFHLIYRSDVAKGTA